MDWLNTTLNPLLAAELARMDDAISAMDVSKQIASFFIEHPNYKVLGQNGYLADYIVSERTNWVGYIIQLQTDFRGRTGRGMLVPYKSDEWAYVIDTDTSGIWFYVPAEHTFMVLSYDDGLVQYPYDEHVRDTTIHVTADEKTSWSSKSAVHLVTWAASDTEG